MAQPGREVRGGSGVPPPQAQGGRARPRRHAAASAGTESQRARTGAHPWLPLTTLMAALALTGTARSEPIQFGPGFEITSVLDGPVSIHGADLDDDGDIDLIGADGNSGNLLWWENTTGLGTSWLEHLASTNLSDAWQTILADFDGDGDLDLAGASWSISWWENPGYTSKTWPIHPVGPLDLGAIAAADLDGDGDTDVASAGRWSGAVSWWENVGGEGSDWIGHSVTSVSGGVGSIVAADLDGDKHIDLAVGGADGGVISWWQNADGLGTNWVDGVVASGFVGTVGLVASDMDRDGDADLVGAADSSGRVTWWENDEPGLGAWSEHPVAVEFEGASSVVSVDLDGDGDGDLAGSATGSGALYWWENLDADGATWAEHPIATGLGMPAATASADVNGDGAVDLAVASQDGTITWWENLGIPDDPPDDDDDTADDDDAANDDDAVDDDDAIDDDAANDDDAAQDGQAADAGGTVAPPGFVLRCNSTGGGTAGGVALLLFACLASRRRRGHRASVQRTPGAAILVLTSALATWPRPAQSDPSADVALRAHSVYEQHCARIDSERTTAGLGALEQVVAVTRDLSEVFDREGATFLRYWRGVLLACANQNERAAEDFEAFLSDPDNERDFPSLVTDATRRSRRLARGGPEPPHSQPAVGVGIGGLVEVLADPSWVAPYGGIAFDLSVMPTRVVGGQFVARVGLSAPAQDGSGQLAIPRQYSLLPVVGGGLVLLLGGSVHARLGLAVQVAFGDSDLQAAPALPGVLVQAGLELPLGRSPLTLRPGIEVGNLGPLFDVRGGLQVVIWAGRHSESGGAIEGRPSLGRAKRGGDPFTATRAVANDRRSR